MNENRRSIAKERVGLQELISDISHQVKTPIANLKMINSTLMEQEVPPHKQNEFLLASASQLIFLAAIVFSLITVFISCKKPAALAAKVSPMEALRYRYF